ncbi:MAG: hypothetical protein CBC25_08475 [Pelagibacteraceae bacterium TMED65]|nr:hypothetical protein [Rickettsiales bacterium]OUU50296.1 MAG: hypothetical protein CBC25_08475 [Pelagibacteraceae bacterium TMED65]|tara:strand:- start:1944 stop:2366 length:423 start_codon:yes stop_codon:yes gene_type:complete
MYLKKLLISFLFFIFLTSCIGESLVPVKGPEGDPSQELNFSQFDDIPIPVNSKLIREDSIIISRKVGWSGRLVFDTSENQIDVFDFFRNELPKFGWKKISEVSSESSLLNYQNNQRFASIQIFEKTLFGCKVKITVTEVE